MAEYISWFMSTLKYSSIKKMLHRKEDLMEYFPVAADLKHDLVELCVGCWLTDCSSAIHEERGGRNRFISSCNDVIRHTAFTYQSLLNAAISY